MISVATLLDKHGKVVGYAAGTHEETEVMVKSTWASCNNSWMSNAEDVLKEAMTTRVQDLRRDAEVNGVTIDGNVFATDPNSQIKYVAALLHCTRNPGFIASWKTLNNGFINIDSNKISIVYVTVFTYIQLCFAWEQAMLAKVMNASTVSELTNINLAEGKPNGTVPSESMPVVNLGPIDVSAKELLVSGDAQISGDTTVTMLKSSSIINSGALASGSISSTGTLTAGASTVTALKTTSIVNTGTMSSGAITGASVTSKKFKGNSASPLITRGPGSGTTSTVTLTTGSTDSAGQLSVATAGAITITAGTIIATVTFNAAYSAAPFVIIHPSNLNSGSLQYQPFVTVTTTGFSISVSSMSFLNLANTYTWMYHVIQ